MVLLLRRKLRILLELQLLLLFFWALFQDVKATLVAFRDRDVALDERRAALSNLLLQLLHLFLLVVALGPLELLWNN